MRTNVLVWLALSVALTALAGWQYLADDWAVRYEAVLRLWSVVIAVIAAWGVVAPNGWLRRPRRNWRYRNPEVPTGVYVVVMRAASVAGVVGLGIAMPVWLTALQPR